MTTSVQVRGRDDHSSPAQEWEHLKLVYTVSPLRKNLQDENFQRCWWKGVNEVAACLWSPITDDSSALPFPTSSLPSKYFFLPVHLMPAPACQLSCWTTEHFKVLYHKIFKKCFLCMFFMYYLHEKCYKPMTVQYYIVDCASRVPRPTLLELWQIGPTQYALRTELIHM